ncbi:MAG TPA: DUF6427 family protein [Flavobacterium sp.]|nr:DUF6427 family protein [Flavobacterium sp.]
MVLNSLFEKNKPISYVVIAVLLFVVYAIDLIIEPGFTHSLLGWTKMIFLSLLMVISVLLVQFIIFKNKLSEQNMYALFFYTCFLILFQTYFNNSSAILANFFILLAIRRIFSMNSLIQLRLKIFDASLWIFVATIFEPWCILYLVLLLFSIVWYRANDYKNWLIPIISAGVIATIFYTICIFSGFSFFEYWENHFVMNFDFSYFENTYQNIALAIFSSIACLFFFAKILTIRNIPMSEHHNYYKILLCFLTGIAVYVLSDIKTNSLLVYSFFPLAILGANYVEKLPKLWMKETVLASILVISIIIFVLQIPLILLET